MTTDATAARLPTASVMITAKFVAVQELWFGKEITDHTYRSLGKGVGKSLVVPVLGQGKLLDMQAFLIAVIALGGEVKNHTKKFAAYWVGSRY
jgi:hypothetical protein